ncbi:MAG TPA: glycosyltransferase, partial [Plasticicumulans sp.]|nr:glycosyltransferase [Plasticicumulans sp.]
MRKNLFIVLLVVAANLGIWAALNRPIAEEPWHGMINGFSYSPYGRDDNPLESRMPKPEAIDRDLALLAQYGRSVRTYSAIDGLEVIPGLAQKHGLQVTLGAWLDQRTELNKREIDSLIDLGKRYDNVTRLVVGNEAILRADLTVRELAQYLRQVRKAVNKPVSTAEPWHVWLRFPELVQEVDFIAVQLLPYWEKVPFEQAVEYVTRRYNELRTAYPDKPILISEVGWPSEGNRVGAAVPSLAHEARFIRRFLNEASENGMDYFVMEAFDQPWKKGIEGSVGAYWGVFSASREPKFPMSGLIEEDASWNSQAVLAACVALLPMVLFGLRFRNLRAHGQLFFAVLIQASASLLVWTLFVPAHLYLTDLGLLLLGILLPAQIGLLLVALINGFEFTEVLWKQDWKRAFKPLTGHEARTDWPMVSLHLACYNEPPELVIETLNSLAALDYPNFEVLVIDNNTPDEAVWRPLEAHCAKLGPHFRFMHLKPWKGFKAGALNFGLRRTHPSARIVGVIDADYLVTPDWLRSLVPYFDDPKVGFVQAPQDHRDWQHDRFTEWANWEYSGFFNIGMVHRNERDAIIQHGTMTLIRKAAIDASGPWAEWCICEDSELGLRVMEEGYEAVYVNHAFGKGVAPDTFGAYKGQRFRWAYGAVQILKRYWKWMLPGFLGGTGRLTASQKFHFVTGWLPWFADALHLVFTISAMLWSVGLLLLPQYFEFPLAVFLFPTLGMFAFKIMHSFVLYTARVPCSLSQRLGAAVAGMGLTHSIARAIFAGLFTKGRAFLRTPKGENSAALVRGLLMAREEGLILLALWTCAFGVGLEYGLHVREVTFWIVILLVQSIPYAAAVLHSIASALPGGTRDSEPAAPAALAAG